MNNLGNGDIRNPGPPNPCPRGPSSTSSGGPSVGDLPANPPSGPQLGGKRQRREPTAKERLVAQNVEKLCNKYPGLLKGEARAALLLCRNIFINACVILEVVDMFSLHTDSTNKAENVQSLFCSPYDNGPTASYYEPDVVLQTLDYNNPFHLEDVNSKGSGCMNLASLRTTPFRDQPTHSSNGMALDLACGSKSTIDIEDRDDSDFEGGRTESVDLDDVKERVGIVISKMQEGSGRTNFDSLQTTPFSYQPAHSTSDMAIDFTCESKSTINIKDRDDIDFECGGTECADLEGVNKRIEIIISRMDEGSGRTNFPSLQTTPFSDQPAHSTNDMAIDMACGSKFSIDIEDSDDNASGSTNLASLQTTSFNDQPARSTDDMAIDLPCGSNSIIYIEDSDDSVSGCTNFRSRQTTSFNDQPAHSTNDMAIDLSCGSKSTIYIEDSDDSDFQC